MVGRWTSRGKRGRESFPGHIAGSDRPLTLYSLDVVISVGYRVKSPRGTLFRIWAARVLRDHLVQGYAVHERRLKELNRAVRLIADVAGRRALSGDEASALLRVVADYSYALDVLDDYDHQRIVLGEVTRGEVVPLVLEEARQVIEQMRKRFGGSELFGREKDRALEGSLAAVVQSFAAPTSSRVLRRRPRTSSTSWSRTITSSTATSASPPRSFSGSWRRTWPSTGRIAPSGSPTRRHTSAVRSATRYWVGNGTSSR